MFTQKISMDCTQEQYEKYLKADYQDKTPYDTDLKLKEGASKEYYKWVKKVGKISKIK